MRKLPDGHMWYGVRLTKRLATSRPDHLWPQNMEKHVKELQNEGEAKLGKLEIARRLRGIYFTEPEDEEFKEIIKNARNKLQVLQQLLQCFAKKTKGGKYAKTRSKNDDFKSRLTCILEAEESKRLRMEGSTPRIHEDHIVGKGSHSQQLCN